MKYFNKVSHPLYWGWETLVDNLFRRTIAPVYRTYNHITERQNHRKIIGWVRAHGHDQIVFTFENSR